MTAENSVTPDKISAKSISRDFHCGNNGASVCFNCFFEQTILLRASCNKTGKVSKILSSINGGALIPPLNDEAVKRNNYYCQPTGVTVH